MATATFPVAASRQAPLALLAGSGRFPVLVAEKARRLGLPVVCAAIRSEATAELADLVDEFHWVKLGGLGATIRHFKRAHCERVVMAGKITKAVIHNPWRWIQLWPDLRTFQWWFRNWRKDGRDDSILLSVIKEFALDGLTCISALDICPELLLPEGLLTERSPTDRENADIAAGWKLAKIMGGLDVGQSVVVKDGVAVAVEAIEGTDQAIRRAGELRPEGGLVVVKVAKPRQDMRFDVPTIGCSTLENLHRAGATVLAIEAGKTIVIDQPEVAALAERYGIAVVVLRRSGDFDPGDLPVEKPLIVARLGRRPTNAREEGDIDFAWDMAQRMDKTVGRSVIVKEKAVLVVEANEGSSAAFQRAGRVCRAGGFVVVQTIRVDGARPKVDDATLRALVQAGGRVLAVEGEGDPEWAKLADRFGVSVVVLRGNCSRPHGDGPIGRDARQSEPLENRGA